MIKEFKHIPEKKNNMFKAIMIVRLTEYMISIAHDFWIDLFWSNERDKYIYRQQIVLRSSEVHAYTWQTYVT